jgi:hypothetical protein
MMTALRGEDDGKLLLCDTCEKVYHMHCLVPPLKKVPNGTWSCAGCHETQMAGRGAGDARAVRVGTRPAPVVPMGWPLGMGPTEEAPQLTRSQQQQQQQQRQQKRR